MTAQDEINLLKENISNLKDSEKWLKRSYEQCKPLIEKREFNANDYDAIEAFSSRFARTVDFLIHIVLKNIDRIELEDIGTIIDVINRAHKRKIIDNPDEIREIKELRNQIVHEYTQTDITEHFTDLVQETPKIFELIDKTINYCNKYL